VTQPLDILGRGSGASRSRKRRKSQPTNTKWRVSRSVSASARLLGSTRSSGDSRLVESFGEGFSRDRRLSLVASECGGHSEQDFLACGWKPNACRSARSRGHRSDACRVQLLKEMGQTDFSEVMLTERMDASAAPIRAVDIQEVLGGAPKCASRRRPSRSQAKHSSKRFPLVRLNLI